MRLRLALIFTLAMAPAAFADDFSARIAAGRAAAATPAGDEFAISLNPLLQEAGRLCDPPGMVLPASALGPLDLVGDITRAGALVNVMTRPQTTVGACLAARLTARRYSPPPWPGNYPLFIHLTVTN